ncbi:conserved hypothetical protein [Uncinocarpus reesii 1704]|uniref:Methyltransferase type 11 domain-containing protein n=1 Tax=Uncinocarpus reesii (strain UAMH 1704) TaxID=336963 RepID=C4JGP8_UNCRE|nr:uncharacterized protein UREG_02560 [Uncinocarpus reesii 1704]EEP77711.1 conserved hypothetical protein [Uncinocarpus reesii 1704]
MASPDAKDRLQPAGLLEIPVDDNWLGEPDFEADLGPNDEQQNEQLDIAHHMFSLLLGGKLLLAPVNKDTQTLGLVLVRDFADEYPSAEVTGTDLSPIQPSFVPPNVSFEIEDATEEWTYPPNHFDLIHTRALYGAIADWPEFYKRVLSHLKPGGWFDQLEMSIQFQSDDGSVKDDHILSIWSRTFTEIGEKLGKTFRIAELAKGYMEEAGFEEVTEVKFKLPVGGWNSDKHLKDLGRWNLIHCEQGIEGWAMALLTRVLKWSFDEVMTFLAQMRVGLRDPKAHAYFNVWVLPISISSVGTILIG